MRPRDDALSLSSYEARLRAQPMGGISAALRSVYPVCEDPLFARDVLVHLATLNAAKKFGGKPPYQH